MEFICHLHFEFVSLTHCAFHSILSSIVFESSSLIEIEKSFNCTNWTRRQHSISHLETQRAQHITSYFSLNILNGEKIVDDCRFQFLKNQQFSYCTTIDCIFQSSLRLLIWLNILINYFLYPFFIVFLLCFVFEIVFFSILDNCHTKLLISSFGVNVPIIKFKQFWANKKPQATSEWTWYQYFNSPGQSTYNQINLPFRLRYSPETLFWDRSTFLGNAD